MLGLSNENSEWVGDKVEKEKKKSSSIGVAILDAKGTLIPQYLMIEIEEIAKQEKKSIPQVTKELIERGLSEKSVTYREKVKRRELLDNLTFEEMYEVWKRFNRGIIEACGGKVPSMEEETGEQKTQERAIPESQFLKDLETVERKVTGTPPVTWGTPAKRAEEKAAEVDWLEFIGGVLGLALKNKGVREKVKNLIDQFGESR